VDAKGTSVNARVISDLMSVDRRGNVETMAMRARGAEVTPTGSGEAFRGW
jgi:hypothetical protein